MLWGLIRADVSSLVRRFIRRTEGQDLIEYGLLIGMLSIVLLSSLSQIGTKVSDMYGKSPVVADRSGNSNDPGSASPGGNSGPNGNNGNPGNSNPANGNPGNSNGNPGNSNPANGNPGDSNGNPGNSNPSNGNNGK